MKIGFFVLLLVIYYLAVFSCHLLCEYKYFWCKGSCIDCGNWQCKYFSKSMNADKIILDLLVDKANSFKLNVYAVRWMRHYGYVVFKNGDYAYRAINGEFVEVAHFLLDEIKENFELETQLD